MGAALSGTVTTFVNRKQEHEITRGFAGVIEEELDFSAISVASGATVQALKVGDGMVITRVSTVVKTPEGGTLTVDVGDGSGASGWDTGVDLDATTSAVARSEEAAASDTYGKGKYYTAADTIDLIMKNKADGAVIHMAAEYVRINT